MSQTVPDTDNPFARAASSVEGAFALTLAAAIAASAIASPLSDVLFRFAQPLAVTLVLAIGFWLRPVSGLLALAIFVLGYDTLALYVGNPVKQTDELAIPAVALIALIRYRPWRGWRWSLLRDGGIALFVAAGIAASLVNAVPITIWAPALVLVIKPVVVFYVGMCLPIDRSALLAAARAVLAIGIVIAVLGLIEAFDPGGFQRAIGLPEWVRPRGILPSIKSIFTHPAILAWFMSFLMLYSFIGFVHLRTRWLLVLGFLFGVTIFLTARRRAILSAIGTIGLAFAWTVRRPGHLVGELRRWAPVFGATALMVVAFIPGLVGLYDRTVDRFLPGETPAPTEGEVGAPIDDENPQTAPARVALYMGSLEIARDNFPLGAGMGRYGSWMSRVEYSPVYVEYGLNRVPGLRANNSQYATDTFWPMVLGEFGVVGVVGYAAFLAGIALPLWGLGRRVKDPQSAVFIVGGLAVLATSILESTATPMFTSPPRSYLLFATLGATLAIWQLRSPSAANEEPVDDQRAAETAART
jgi:hypothetical protein